MKSRNRLSLQAFWLSVACLASLNPVGAVTLLPGDSVPLFGTTTAAQSDIGSSVLITQSVNFQQTDSTGNVLFSGTIEQRARNYPLGGFGLLFDYQITNFTDNGGGFRITALSTNSFTDFMLDVDYRLDEAGDIAPSIAFWPLQGDPVFNHAPVTFSFSDLLLAGNTSRSMFVASISNDIPVFGGFGAELTVIGLSGDNYLVPFASFSAIIPVPAGVWLFGSGLLGLIGVARRKVRV